MYFLSVGYRHFTYYCLLLTTLLPLFDGQLLIIISQATRIIMLKLSDWYAVLNIPNINIAPLYSFFKETETTVLNYYIKYVNRNECSLKLCVCVAYSAGT